MQAPNPTGLQTLAHMNPACRKIREAWGVQEKQYCCRPHDGVVRRLRRPVGRDTGQFARRDAWQAARCDAGELPKALKSPFDSMTLTVPLWGPMAYDFNCITHLDECQGQPKKASLLSLPKILKPQLDRLSLDTRALPPMAHSVFCFQYPKDCTIRKIAFRGGKFALTPQRWRDLEEVNAKVNRSIKPERNLLGLAGEKWIVGSQIRRLQRLRGHQTA